MEKPDRWPVRSSFIGHLMVLAKRIEFIKIIKFVPQRCVPSEGMLGSGQGEIIGWARQGSNLHGLLHRILSPACLPIPPRARPKANGASAVREENLCIRLLYPAQIRFFAQKPILASKNKWIYKLLFRRNSGYFTNLFNSL
jgi:hypothetical protein